MHYSSKTSWRRCNNVSLHVRVTSQVRPKWKTKRRLNGTSPRRLSGTSPRRLKRTYQRRPISTSPWHLKKVSNETQRRLSGTLPRRLSGAYPRRPISTSLRRLLKVPNKNKTPKNFVVVPLGVTFSRRLVSRSLLHIQWLCHNLRLVGF